MNSNKGFTLIEVLITFSIFLVITSLIPQFIKLISYEPKLLQHTEVSIFFQQLAMDVQMASTIHVENNILYLQHENENEITYSFFQFRVRRQVNNTGQEIVLQNVAELNFSKWVNGIDVFVKDRYNQTHEKRITHFISLKAVQDV